jgi:hypothetical protein
MCLGGENLPEICRTHHFEVDALLGFPGRAHMELGSRRLYDGRNGKVAKP